jgi:hypothetical protein
MNKGSATFKTHGTPKKQGETPKICHQSHARFSVFIGVQIGPPLRFQSQ